MPVECVCACLARRNYTQRTEFEVPSSKSRPRKPHASVCDTTYKLNTSTTSKSNFQQEREGESERVFQFQIFVVCSRRGGGSGRDVQ